MPLEFRDNLRTCHLQLLVAPSLAWSARSDASIEFVNQPWLDYTGLSAEQAMDWGWKVAIHPEDLPRMLEIFQEAASSGQLFEAEGRLRRRDGEFSPLTIGSKAHSLLASSVVRQLASGSSNRKVSRQKKCGSAVFQVHFLCIPLAG
jgi:PAS domain S-box-containing protein